VGPHGPLGCGIGPPGLGGESARNPRLRAYNSVYTMTNPHFALFLPSLSRFVREPCPIESTGARNPRPATRVTIGIGRGIRRGRGHGAGNRGISDRKMIINVYFDGRQQQFPPQIRTGRSSRRCCGGRLVVQSVGCAPGPPSRGGGGGCPPAWPQAPGAAQDSRAGRASGSQATAPWRPDAWRNHTPSCKQPLASVDPVGLKVASVHDLAR